MATTGQQVQVSDFGNLASIANAKSSMLFCGIDPNGGYNVYYDLIGITINTTGSGYKVGDIVSMGYGDSFEVFQVSPTGGILGLLQYSKPTVTNTSGLSGNLSGGSGTGGGVLFTIGSPYGFTGGTSNVYNNPVPYSFSDYYINQGNITSIIPISGGINYAAGNQIILPVLGITASVASASIAGAITALSNYNSLNTTIPYGTNNMTPINVSPCSGSGAIIAALLSMPQPPNNLRELQRMRANLYWLLNGGGSSNAFSYIGCQETYPIYNAPSYEAYGSSPTGVPAGNLNYYYKTLNNSGTNINAGQGSAFESNPDLGTWNQFENSPTSVQSITCNIVVGGNLAGTLQGQFSFIITNTGNGVNMLNATSTLPGCTFAGPVSCSGNLTSKNIVSNGVTSSVSPGTYSFTATITNTSGAPAQFQQLYVLGTNCSFVHTFSGPGSATPALCTSSVVNVINCYDTGTPTVYSSSFGVYYNVIKGYYTVSDHVWYEVLTPMYSLTYAATNGSGHGPTPSYWTGNPPPVSTLFTPGVSNMPQNYLISYTEANGSNFYGNPMLSQSQYIASGSSNGYTLGTPIEQQNEWPQWKANTYFGKGFTIQDSNFNLQQCIFSGFTGNSNPTTWPTVSGQTYTESGSKTPLAEWQCIQVYNSNSNPTGSSTIIMPAQHRNNNAIGRYPCVWTSETDPYLMEPSSSTTAQPSASAITKWGTSDQWRNNIKGIGWQYNNVAGGSFIYLISGNRITNTSGSTTFTLGCMTKYSGATSYTFTSWGTTYNTGQWYQVLIPIFDSSAVYYQASERLDIQILTIAYGNGEVGSGYTVNANGPMLASYINDTAQMLSMID